MSLNDQINKFFNEFIDTKKSTKFWSVLLVLSFFGILGIYSNLRTDPDIAFACTIYEFFLIFCAVAAGFDFIKEKIWFVGNVLSGKWAYFGLVPFIIGTIFGYFTVSQSQTIGLSFLQLSGINAFVFIVLLAPVIEEWFFRWSIFPTLREQLKGLTKYYSIAALLIVNGGFGIFHYYIYGANINAVWIAAFLGIIYTIGNYSLKSGTFSIGAHMTNNYLLWAMAGGVLFG